MIVEEFFEKIFFPNLKKYTETSSIYGPLVTKAMPQESKRFPIVPIKLIDSISKYTTLSYDEEAFNFGIIINVYAVDNGNTSKRTICNEVTNTIVNYIKDEYKMTVKIELDVPNSDSNVQRNIITITGKIDTKYGLDKLVIYPK